jgi:RNA polymerase sigma factor (sigma-70 family)
MDRELVARAQGGDHDAFAAIAASTIGRLTALARLILQDEDRAQEAVQDALVDAWRDIRALRDPDRADAWLRRLLVRACYDAAKRHRRRAVVDVRVLQVEPAVSDAQDAVATRDQLDRGLRRLSPDQRAALVLTYYLDLPLAEAAHTLDIPVGTMKSRLNRALNALRAALDADERAPAPVREHYA